MDDREEVHVRLAYVSHSLRNVDCDGDGVADGFVFELKNPPIAYGGSVIKLDVLADDEEINADDVWVRMGTKETRADMISDERRLSFSSGTASSYTVKKRGGLPAGKHRIVLRMLVEGFMDIYMFFGFTDEVQKTDTDPIIVKSEELSYPMVLAGKSAFAVFSRSGDLSVNRNWMGVTSDSGGLYVPPARFMRGFRIGILEDKLVWLSELTRRFENRAGYTTSYCELRGCEIDRDVFVPSREPGVVTKLRVNNKTTKPSKFEFVIEAAPEASGAAFMGVVPKSQKIVFNEGLGLFEVTTPEFPYVAAFGCDRKPNSYVLNYEGELTKEMFDGERSSEYTGSTHKMAVLYEVEVAPMESQEITLVLVGDLKSMEQARKSFSNLLREREKIFNRDRDEYQAYLRNTVSIDTPDLQLNTAFTLAKVGLKHLQADHPEIGIGVPAGYPRFTMYYARDSGWILPAYLSIGDFEFVKPSIENFLNRQAKEDSKELGAIKGEVPSVIGSKALLRETRYGGADSNQHLATMVYEYVTRSGDRKFLENHYNALLELMQWGFRADRDGDHLIEHGAKETIDVLLPGKGEAVSRWRAPDTTLQDHVDRRKSANDVQALWASALKKAAWLARVVGDRENAKKWENEATIVENILKEAYWNKEKSYFYETMKPDRTMKPEIRTNALVLLFQGIATNEQAEKVLNRVEGPQLTTPWGVRGLSSDEPTYFPKGFSNQVWPLRTAWTAMAEFRYNRILKGYEYLHLMADQIVTEGGMYNENYRGDVKENFTSCILQSWSLSTFITACLDYMFGISANAIENTIYLRPRFPNHWSGSSIKNFRIGDSRVDMIFDAAKGSVAVRNNGKKKLVISTEVSKMEVDGGETKATPFR